MDNTAPYPRDMVGYGESPPDPKWPGGARIALNFVINYEEGGENTLLHGDAASEGLMTDVPGHPTFAAQEGKRNLLVESMYEYGSRAGIWRILRLFKQYEVKGTVFAIGMALERNPAAAKAMAAAGHEIATHGYRWIDYGAFSEAEEKRHLQLAIEAGRETTGERPVGWFIGRGTPQSRRLAAEEGGFLYDSDAYCDDLPFWAVEAGKSVLVLPYALDTNDMGFTTSGGFTDSEQFFVYLRDAFDMLYAEGGRMMSVGLHPRVIGRPARAQALKRFLEHVRRHDKVWVCRRDDIAKHWRANFPFSG